MGAAVRRPRSPQPSYHAPCSTTAVSSDPKLISPEPELPASEAKGTDDSTANKAAPSSPSRREADRTRSPSVLRVKEANESGGDHHSGGDSPMRPRRQTGSEAGGLAAPMPSSPGGFLRSRSPSLASAHSSASSLVGRLSFRRRTRLPSRADWADSVAADVSVRLQEDVQPQLQPDSPDLAIVEAAIRDIHAALHRASRHGELWALSFSDLRIGDKAIVKVMSVLSESESGRLIGVLCFRNTLLTHIGLESVLKYTATAPQLNTLDLSCNPIGPIAVCQVISETTSHPGLQTLNLSFTGADDSIAPVASQYLLNTSVPARILSLAGNMLHSDAVTSLLNSIASSPMGNAGPLRAPHIDLLGCPGYTSMASNIARNNLVMYSSSLESSSPQSTTITSSNSNSPAKNSSLSAANLCKCHSRDTPINTSVLHHADGVLSTYQEASSAPLRDILVIRFNEADIPASDDRMSPAFIDSMTPRSPDFLLPCPSSLTDLIGLSITRSQQMQGRFNIGFADTIGRRPTMEDSIIIIENFRENTGDYLIGLFDGHGGPEASRFASDNLVKVVIWAIEQLGPDETYSVALRNAFKELNSQMSTFLFCGTTAIAILIINDDMYTASVGDSRMVLTRGGEPLRMTIDHKPDLPDEKRRIVSSGGYVQDGRVNGVLSVSRVLGDAFLHPLVSWEPYSTVTHLHLQETESKVDVHTYRHLFMDDYVILACDGVWDVLSDYEASMIVRLTNYQANPQAAAEAVRNAAFGLGSMDNITVLVIVFQGPFLPRVKKDGDLVLPYDSSQSQKSY